MNALLLKAAPWAIAALAAVGFKLQYDAKLRAEGAARQVLEQTAPQRDSIRVLKDSLARAATVQVETLRVAVVRRVPVRDTVEVFLRDSVPVPVEIVRELVRVDSAVIQACTVALNTCAQEKAVLRRDVLLAERQADAYRRLIPSGFAKARSTLTTAAIVGVACYFLCPRKN